MRQIWVTFLFLSTYLTSGCNAIQRGKLLAPESFGLIPIAQNVYIEVGADEAARVKFHEAIARAEEAIRAAYGSVNSRPIFHACITEQCYRTFGERDSVAGWFYYGDRLLLSPRGLNWHLIAHEWSHAEMSNRLTFFAWKRMPRWFDEGVAVALSEAPEHSESHWQFLVAANISHPTREELHTFVSLKQWIDALHRYGDDKNIERKAKGEPEIRPVYTAAGHELRPWLTRVGSAGLIAFIARMNDGEDFESVYQTANTAVERD